MGIISRIKGYMKRKRRVQKSLDDMKQLRGKDLEARMGSFLFDPSIEKVLEFSL